MTNVPERIKKALFEKGWTQKKLCSEIDITENGFKRMVDNNSWKLDTVEKVALALGLPIEYFLSDNDHKFDKIIHTNKKDDDVYLQEYLRKLEDKFNKLLDQLVVKDHQLESKDQQINSLQEMLKMILGKPEGADLDQLFTTTGEVETDLPRYVTGTFTRNVLPALFLSQP